MLYLFASNESRPVGGWADFKGFMTADEALRWIDSTGEDLLWWQLVDPSTRRIISSWRVGTDDETECSERERLNAQCRRQMIERLISPQQSRPAAT